MQSLTPRRQGAGAYDWYIRSRPDLEFAYDVTWPPPRKPDDKFADVYSSIAMGKLNAYAWRDQLTVNMFNPLWRTKLIPTRGKCPREAKEFVKSFHDPCVDISDHIAAVKSQFAGAYFGFPRSMLSATLASTNSPWTQNFKCSFWHKPSKKSGNVLPPEGLLNFRLRRAGADLAPMDFAYILAPSREVNMKCSNNISGSLLGCLEDGAWKTKTAKELTSVVEKKGLRITCHPGISQGKSSIPVLIDRTETRTQEVDKNEK